MRLFAIGTAALVAVGGSGMAGAQGSWTPQASPSPTPPPPIYISPTPSEPRQTKERPATPKGNPGTWVTEDDYPTSALRAEEQGTTGFLLEIDPEGRVTRCDITAPSGSPTLDEATCALMMKRAQFNPALNKKGKPVAGSWSSRFKWVIPEPEIYPAPEAFSSTMTFVIEPDGSATNCATDSSRGGQVDKGPCGIGPVFEPYRDASGNPVRRKVTMKIDLTVVDPDAPPPPPPPAPPPAPTRKKRP